jgi:hypothetical protein
LPTSRAHIATALRNLLPADKKEASWGYLASQFPWYGMVHMLRAAEHPDDEALLQKAALYAPDVLRLHGWIHLQESILSPLPPQEEDTEGAGNFAVKEGDAPLENEENRVAEMETEIKSGDVEIERDDAPEESQQDQTDSDTPLKLPGLANLKEKVVSDVTELPLEPYHSVDYFASQGIKIENRIPGKEETALDKQVKSFTDWLKTMKRLKYQPATEYIDPLVETQAKKSLDQKEIVTEAMAEVWVKQGKFTEAAQVYARLMLLYPEKTPYFAARLQELNSKK